MENVDYIIIGQGIAGTLLAHFLKQKGQKVIVIDNLSNNSSSMIAAGIFNPVTGRRFVTTWKAAEIFPFAQQTYLQLEQLLHSSFYHETGILKFFNDQLEQKEWMLKDTHNAYAALVENSAVNPAINQPPWGGVKIASAGYLDIRVMLNLYRKLLVDSKEFIATQFHYDDIDISQDSVQWQQVKARRMIFCEGHTVLNNPWFREIPFNPAKGEILIIHAPELKLDTIINRGGFILPIGNDLYKIGSTYSWDYTDDRPSSAGRAEIISKLDSLLNCDYTVKDHFAGIRPTIKDRRPVMGLHPKYKCIGIFNGMGTKGVSLAPYFAEHFASFLENEAPLDKEADIARFTKHFKAL